MRLTSLLLLLTLTALAFAAPAPDVHAIAKSVDGRYNHLRTLRAEFTELYRGAGMERTESGTLWLKKPGRMRWEYRAPREKLFVGDGKDAWFYVPGEGQVRKIAMSKLDDWRSPLALLLGKTKLEKELLGLSFAPDVPPLDPQGVMLRGVPRGLQERVSQVLLEITPNDRIARILIDEVDGSSTEYRFHDQTENQEISDRQFQFTPPAGAEVIEGEMEQ